MPPERVVTQELSLGEVVSKTFDLYRRNFVKYLTLYLVVEAVIGAVSTVAYGYFVLPTLPANPTQQQIVDWFPGYFGTLVQLVAVTGIVGVVLGTIALGGTIRMASEEIENRPVELGASVRFAASKLLWIWALGLLVGIIVGVGFIALIVPGIILLIMFILAFPALLIENAGVVGSLGRSRELVGHRWLKTFGLLLIMGIIVALAAGVVSLVSGPFGWASVFVTSVLGALYQPLIPVAVTLFYYSNLARTAPLQTGPQVMGSAPVASPGMKFCPNCGTQLAQSATFCSRCGAKQPV